MVPKTYLPLAFAERALTLSGVSGLPSVIDTFDNSTVDSRPADQIRRSSQLMTTEDEEIELGFSEF